VFPADDWLERDAFFIGGLGESFMDQYASYSSGFGESDVFLENFKKGKFQSLQKKYAKVQKQVQMG